MWLPGSGDHLVLSFEHLYGGRRICKDSSTDGCRVRLHVGAVADGDGQFVSSAGNMNTGREECTPLDLLLPVVVKIALDVAAGIGAALPLRLRRPRGRVEWLWLLLLPGHQHAVEHLEIIYEAWMRTIWDSTQGCTGGLARRNGKNAHTLQGENACIL